MKISDFNERITVYRSVSTKDPNGRPAYKLEEVHSCWACVRDQFMRDKETTAGTYLEETMNIMIRHMQRETITRAMLIQWRGKNYDIVTISVGERYDVMAVRESDKKFL